MEPGRRVAIVGAAQSSKKAQVDAALTRTDAVVVEGIAERGELVALLLNLSRQRPRHGILDREADGAVGTVAAAIRETPLHPHVVLLDVALDERGGATGGLSHVEAV